MSGLGDGHVWQTPLEPDMSRFHWEVGLEIGFH
jgi:hypothetical protein